MSCSKALAVVLVTLALSACGFRPLYGTSSGPEESAVMEKLAAVDVGIVADRSGQILRNELRDLLNPGRLSVPDTYRLEAVVDEDEQDVALQSTGFATRTAVRLTARYQLIDSKSGSVLLNSKTRVVSTFNIISNKYSTVVAGESARERGIRQIAQEIRQRLAVYFAQNKDPAVAGLDKT
jgi:LPS-assembly lipoprotein